MDKLREAMRRRHYSRRAEVVFTGWVRRFILFHGKRHPRAMGREEVRAFLLGVNRGRGASPGEKGEALSVLVFLYRHVLELESPWLEDLIRQVRPARLAEALTREETRRLISCLEEEYRLIALLLYGSGLYLRECLALRVRDVDLSRGRITVRAGKGGDRLTLLARCASQALASRLQRVGALHEEDLSQGAGWAFLPPSLSRRAPGVGRQLEWQFLFPAPRIHVPLDGSRRGLRYPLHPEPVQQAIRRAALIAGIPGPTAAGTLRHGFAAHLLEDGFNLPTVGALLGYEDSAAAPSAILDASLLERIRSPADTL